jgi:Erythromycin esterase
MSISGVLGAADVCRRDHMSEFEITVVLRKRDGALSSNGWRAISGNSMSALRVPTARARRSSARRSFARFIFDLHPRYSDESVGPLLLGEMAPVNVGGDDVGPAGTDPFAAVLAHARALRSCTMSCTLGGGGPDGLLVPSQRARVIRSRMLVARHGFNIVAVEADWPDAAVYDAYVRGLPRPKVPKRAFTRFPTWMWRNDQVSAFLDRLQAINERCRDPERKCGFYGLDVYSLSASIEAVRLSRRGRSRGCPRCAAALWLPHTVARRACPLRAHGSLARLRRLREAGDVCADRFAQETTRLFAS